MHLGRPDGNGVVQRQDQAVTVVDATDEGRSLPPVTLQQNALLQKKRPRPDAGNAGERRSVEVGDGERLTLGRREGEIGVESRTILPYEPLEPVEDGQEDDHRGDGNGDRDDAQGRDQPDDRLRSGREEITAGEEKGKHAGTKN